LRVLHLVIFFREIEHLIFIILDGSHGLIIVIELAELVILIDTPALLAYILIAAKVIIVVGVL